MCGVSDSLHSRDQWCGQLCVTLVMVQNLQIKHKKNCKTSKIRITLINESINTACKIEVLKQHVMELTYTVASFELSTPKLSHMCGHHMLRFLTSVSVLQ